MLVEDGRVLARGANLEVADVDAVDLDGKTVRPAWIDNHCHILPTGLDMARLNLDPCSTPAEVLDAVRDRLPEVAPGQWLRAVHYDQTKFPDGKHLTRQELDRISPDVPILLRHVNGHASVANSVALALAGITESTEDPKGGTFVRDEAGSLTGVLLEKAHEVVSAAAPKPNLEEMVHAILLACRSMRALGICAACDMMTGQFDLQQEITAYRLAAARGAPIRTRLYLQWSAVFGPRSVPPERLDELRRSLDGDQCKISGIKIFADGAIGSATAAIHGEFTGGGNGQLIYAAERLSRMVRTAHEAGYQIAIHSIGDRSTDLVMDAYEQLGDAKRHRIEHAMILSDAQIERMVRLGIHCTMQPEFLMRFGHSYRRQLGPEVASRLKRVSSVLEAGIPLSFSSDRPIVGGDPKDGVACLTNRPEGFDASENITLPQAIRGYTSASAAAMEDESLGSLLPGQWAEFAVD
jgi:predicted amidohydrolase YtcJ